MSKLNIKKLIELKIKFDLTDEKISSQTGISFEKVEKLFSDKIHHITLADAQALSKLFECSVPDLLEFRNDEEKQLYYQNFQFFFTTPEKAV